VVGQELFGFPKTYGHGSQFQAEELASLRGYRRKIQPAICFPSRGEGKFGTQSQCWQRFYIPPEQGGQRPKSLPPPEQGGQRPKSLPPPYAYPALKSNEGGGAFFILGG